MHDMPDQFAVAWQPRQHLAGHCGRLAEVAVGQFGVLAVADPPDHLDYAREFSI